MHLLGNPLASATWIPDLLREGLERSPDADALISIRYRWTWRDLERTANNLALNLLTMGLEPGDRIASLMPNRATLLIHYLACMRAGLVAVPLNYRYMAPEIDHALEVSGARLLVAHAERNPDLAQSRLAVGLALGVLNYEAVDGSHAKFRELTDSAPAGCSLPDHKPDDPAFIFFTSGSTGQPKGVTHSCKTLSTMFASVADAFEMTPEDVMLPGSSVSHIGGFMFSFAALSSGARCIIARHYDDDELLPLLRQEKPTILCMLPSALLHLVRDHGTAREDFKSLRLCRSGADKVPAELQKEFTELTGMVIDEGYGMTEAGLLTLNPPSGLIKIGSVGRPVPGVALAIRDDGRGDLPVGVAGRLWARSDTATIGYWNNRSATEELFREGWLDTGDVMEADDEGYLRFRGRKKQIIVHDGSNICPQEVEEALLEHESVENVGVVGVHDLMHGENVRAYVTLKDGFPPPTARDLIAFARQRVGYKAPEQVELLQEMPLNPTGKVDRMALKRLAEERHAADGDA